MTAQAIRNSARAKPPKTATPAAPALKAKPAQVLANFAGAYLATPIERIETVRNGVPAALLAETGRAMDLPGERLYAMLHLPRATVARKIAARGLLSPEMSERLLGLRKLIGQVEVMVRESGDPAGFDAAKWLARWLAEPAPALDGRRPGNLMDTADGREIVAGLLARMQSGAYA